MDDQLLRLMGRILTHLPDTEDVALITLKGHLLAEERLFRALETKPAAPNHLSQADLRFSQLVSLVRAFYPADADD